MQTVWTQIRPDNILGLIWIQDVWHSDIIPERIFWKSYFWKKSSDDKTNGKLPSMHCVKLPNKALQQMILAKQFLSISQRNFRILTLRRLGNFSRFFVVCLFFFQNQLFQKSISGIPSECQTVWIRIRPDLLSGLIWVQTVCKGYQQPSDRVDV